MRNDVERQDLSGREPRAHRVDDRILLGAEFLVEECLRLGVALKLAEDLGMSDHPATQDAEIARKDFVGPFEIADRSEGKRLVIKPERLQPLGGRDLVEAAERLGHPARTEFGPGGTERIDGGIDAAARRLILEKVLESTPFRLIRGKRDVRCLTFQTERDDLLRDCLRGIEITERNAADKGPVKQLRVAGIGDQRTGEPGGRVAVVAGDHCRPRGEISPRVFLCGAERERGDRRAEDQGKKRAFQKQGTASGCVRVNVSPRLVHVHAARRRWRPKAARSRDCHTKGGHMLG